MKPSLNGIYKLAILLLIFTASKSAQAQSIWENLPFRDYADFKFQNLNKSYINTGVLYDRVFPIAQLNNHIASANSTDTASPMHFAQAYFEMYQASYNTSGWLAPEQIDAQIESKGNNRQHPIGIFLYDYNMIDTTALDDNLLDTSQNGQFNDVSGRSRTPYFTYTSFMASPLKSENQVLEEGEHSFYIDEQFFLRNKYLNVQQIRIDFGDGEAEWVIDNPFSNNLMQNTQSGSVNSFLNSITKLIGKTLRGRILVIGIDLAGYLVQYSNPFVIFAESKKTYEPLSFCKGGGQKWVIDANAGALATVNTQYGNPAIDYKGVKDTAYFFFAGNGSSCNTGVLRKPIVFIDGFDPDNSRGVQKIYADFINKQVDRNGNPFVKFGDYMLQEGYDLVILDFKHGNDLLERNAMTLVALLQRLYQTYGSTFTQDITLIGPSMGSLIAQYALAYMEHNSLAHHVKTYISFDGCHQGANVPIGIQNYVEYITKRGILKGIKAVREGLYNGLAAKQMLAHHQTANSAFPAPDALRFQFLQNLAAVGEYPALSRNIAVINGSNNGTLNPYHGANTDLLDISLKRNGLLGLCSDNICKRFRWVARTTTNSGSNKVSEMWTLSPVFNLLFWVPPGYTNTYAQAAWGNSAQDNAPGGLIGNRVTDDIQTHGVFLAGELIYLLTGGRPNIMQNINNFTMMPSYSAADLRFGVNNSNKNLYLNWSNEYLCGKTPFDYVYAPATNEEHVSVSQQGSEWFENEAKCDLANLPVFTNKFIYGSAINCSSENYSIDICNTTTNITWTASPANIVTLSPNGNQVILQRIGIASGVVTLSAKIGNACAGSNIIITKTVVVGTPTPSLSITVHCPEVIAFANNSYAANNFTWTIETSSGTQTVNDPTSVQTFKNIYSNAYLCVTYSNACSTSYPVCTSFDCTDNGGHRFSVSPNPTTGDVQIEAIDKKTDIKEIEITDKFGGIKKKNKLSGGTKKFKINMAELPADIYFIRIYDGKGWTSKRVIKN